MSSLRPTPLGWRLPWAAALAFAPSACGGGLAQAVAQFDAGQYPAAEHALASLEPETRGWSVERRAKYALYRALTLQALGDSLRAASWLRSAEDIERGRPGSLSTVDVRRLNVVAPLLSDDSP